MSEHQSFWIATSERPSYPRLERDIEADAVVIGGGIVGIVAAHQLQQAGKKVVLLEARSLAEGITGHTTAKLTSLHGLIYDKLIQRFGKEKARTYGEANQAAIDFVRRISAERGIGCDLAEAIACTFTTEDDKRSQIEKEVEAAQAVGLPATLVSDTSLPFEIVAGIAFSGQAQFHPRKFLLPLAQAVADAGSHVFENTRVVEVDQGEPMRALTADGFTVTAKDVVIATNLPFLNTGLFFSRTTPKREYALAMYADPDRVPAGMFINAGSPTRSVRPASYQDRPVLILAGEGHNVGEQTNHREHWRKLEEWGRSALGAQGVAFRWSAQDYHSNDELPFIGKMTSGADHLFTATGFSAWGMSNGVVAGLLLSDLILGRDNPWAELYDPQRTSVHGVTAFVKKGAHDAKHFTRDRLQKSLDADEADQLRPGEGRLVEVEGEKLAVYRNDEGVLQVVSAVCSHMGCIVHFNDAERSWDCPCHGSRFSTDGEVLHGPAVTPLQSRRELLAEKTTG